MNINLCGDNIELLRQYPDNYSDAIATDAPYGLSKEPDAVAMLNAWITQGYLPVTGSGFMGKKWDSFVPQPNFWKEILRVLKPGGHVLCFFGSRTYDWGVMAMRVAGFEIRDQIMWVYGSGFPKSLDISKALTKENHPEHSKNWQGWGTALKPAHDPIVLARKPIEKGLTIAENIVKYGVGAINIQDCRVDFFNDNDKKSAIFGRGTNIIGRNYVGAKHGNGKTNIEPNPEGRFPSNFIHDGSQEVLAMFPNTKSGKPVGLKTNGGGYMGNYGVVPLTGYGDEGSAARFFYCAKASQTEKNYGLKESNEHPTVKPIELMRYLVRLITPKNGICIDPFVGSGTTNIACYLEDIYCIGMDNDPVSIETANKRLLAWKKMKNTQISLEL